MTIERDLLRTQISKTLSSTIDQTTLFGVSLLNLDSPIQLVKSLNTLGIPVESTDVKVLARYKDNPIVKSVLDYRKYEKFITTYGEALISKIHPKTGRLHTDFTQMVSTGRLSSRDPNLQNIPKEQRYRACFVSAPGYKFVTSDMSQAELRILAEYSRDPAFLEAYATGQDLHTRTACDMFDVTPEEVARDKKLKDNDPNKKGYRDATKAINFGLIYGLTEVGLARRLGCSEKKARNLIDKYFNKYRKIKEHLDKSGKFAVINRYSTTISGRKRFYKLPEPSDPTFNKIRGSVERAGKNHPIQGSNACTIKQAMIYVVERIKNYDARLLLTIHDELIVEVREDQAEEVSAIVSQSMVDGFAEFFKTVKMEADALIGDCWLKG
jgi:DNA polymerase-1